MALPALIASIGLSFTAPASADDAWPSQPVKLVVPWAPGGTVDFTARTLAQKLSDMTGKTFFAENKPGASGSIGYGFVANAKPDGNTAMVFDASYASMPALFTKLPFDHANGFAPVATVVSTPMALVVSASSPYTTTQELIDYAKKNPNKLNFGSGGVGSTPHLAAEMFKQAAGIEMTHIPFKGGGEALLGVMSGTADVLFTASATALSQFKAGKVRVLALTGSHRLPAFGDVPTVGETVKGYVFDNWYGVSLPKGTPPALVAQFNGLLGKALQDPLIRDRFIAQGAEIRFSTPAEFAKLLRDETQRFIEISRSAGIHPE
jgi:tripartite-type tricarboxylate transporter receptor subunit TctC